MHTVTSADGTPIGVWQNGAGPPLLLVHGTTADHTRWSRVTDMFGRDFSVYSMDRRGRGGSGDADAYDIVREFEDVVAVVESIDEPVSLLGHSYGAICCLEAAMLTHNLRRMVLYEPPIPLGRTIVPTETRAKLEAHVERNEREETLRTFFREVVHMPEEQLAALQSHPAWPARVAAAHTVPREMSVEATYRLDFSRVASITTPTLLLLGGESPAVFREATTRVAATLPHSRVHEMPGQQHVAMDQAPEEFVTTVRDFLLS